MNTDLFVNNHESILEQSWKYKSTNYLKDENHKVLRGKESTVFLTNQQPASKIIPFTLEELERTSLRKPFTGKEEKRDRLLRLYMAEGHSIRPSSQGLIGKRSGILHHRVCIGTRQGVLAPECGDERQHTRTSECSISLPGFLPSLLSVLGSSG